MQQEGGPEETSSGLPVTAPVAGEAEKEATISSFFDLESEGGDNSLDDNNHDVTFNETHDEQTNGQDDENTNTLFGASEQDIPFREEGDAQNATEGEKGVKGEEDSDDETKRAKEREGILKSIFGGDDDSSGLSDMDVNDDSGIDLEKRNKKKLDRILKKKQKERKKKRKKKKESEDEDGDEKAAKKAKRKKKAEDKEEKKKKRKRKSKTGDDSEGSQQQPEEDSASQDSSMGSQVEESPFDKALNNIKRRKKTKLDPIVAEQKVGDFITKMEDCAEADIENFQKGEPGLAKVKLLAEVVIMLSKVDLQPIFLERGVLTAFRKWLEPLPDGSLPTFNIRRDLLTLLSKMPIKMDHLKPSGLGKAVMFLWKSPKETPEIKKLAHSLIQEWSRDIFELSTDYRNLAELEEKKDRQRIVRPPSPKETESEHLDLDDVLRTSKGKIKPTEDRLHARIPQPAPLDYTKRPPRKSKELLTQDISSPQLHRTRSMEKKLANIKAKRKKSAITNQSRAVRMSINGNIK